MDDLLGKTIEQNGAPLPDRKLLNFVGFSVSDNPQNQSTDVTAGASGGKDPLSPQSNGGTVAYPVNAAYAIAFGVTFVRSAAADYDSVRIFGAGGIEPAQVSFVQGLIVNPTPYVIAFYALLTQHLWSFGADLGAGAYATIAPGSSLRWALDASLNLHVLG
jgi:hypothetical protein